MHSALSVKILRCLVYRVSGFALVSPVDWLSRLSLLLNVAAQQRRVVESGESLL